MGQLSAREQAIVLQHLADFPILRAEVQRIERALETYALAASVQAPAGIKQRILDEIGRTGNQTVTQPMKGVSSIWRLLAILGILAVAVLIYLLLQKDEEVNQIQQRLDIVIDSCAQQNQQNIAQISILQQLTLPDNEILRMTGTPAFPQTDLYFHHNPVTQRNFIQVRELPTLAANQSFQLWSLKPDVAPIPLTVFQQQQPSQILEVQYEDATASYAITIEPLGGQNAPTLANLIGIVNVGAE